MATVLDPWENKSIDISKRMRHTGQGLEGNRSGTCSILSQRTQDTLFYQPWRVEYDRTHTPLCGPLPTKFWRSLCHVGMSHWWLIDHGVLVFWLNDRRWLKASIATCRVNLSAVCNLHPRFIRYYQPYPKWRAPLWTKLHVSNWGFFTRISLCHFSPSFGPFSC